MYELSSFHDFFFFLSYSNLQGYIVVWDIIQGEPLRVIKLGGGDHSVRQIVAVENSSAIVCDYGNELRVVQLPSQFDDKTE